MDQEMLEAQAAAGGTLAPKKPEREPFHARWQELAAALALYALAYIYVDRLGLSWLWLTLFTLSFAGLAELLYRERPRSRESLFWLSCLALTLLGCILRIETPLQFMVWSIEQSFLFLHLFAVWYVLSRGELFLERQSGTLLPLDALDGFVLIPFRHFFLRLRCLWYALTHLGGRGARPGRDTLVWTGAATAAALFLFFTAFRLLLQADQGFALLMQDLERLLLRWDEMDQFSLLLSLPVGAYLFGLLAGGAREDRDRLDRRGETVRCWLARLQKVPDRAWTLLLAAFCLLYLCFFAVQASYLFGAFSRRLPQGFIVSEYARQGFFELCRVMAVNFQLLWLVTRMSRVPVRRHRPTLCACLLLLAESVLFAVIALSKLWLYIDCFGFTPLRLQSCWGVCVLLLGCVCAAMSLLWEKKTFRPWLFAAALSAALLCLF